MADAHPVSRLDDDHITPGEMFVLAVSILSLLNIALYLLPLSSQTDEVLLIVDGVLCLVLLVDFFVQLRRGGRYYFLSQRGWLDLLGSLPAPGLRLARIFRVSKVASLVRRNGPGHILDEFKTNLAEGALFIVLFAVLIVLEFGAILVLAAERHSSLANITTGGDALWWDIVTITTVGYGDQYPVTPAGRAVGVVVLLTGVALFGTITGYLANTFLGPKARARDDALDTDDADDADEPRAVTVAEMRRLLDEQAGAIDRLRAHLSELEEPAS